MNAKAIALFAAGLLKKRVFYLCAVMLLLLAALLHLLLAPDPLAEYKKTENVSLDPEMEKAVSGALAVIEAKDYKGLFGMMRVKDSQAFQINYTGGIFRKEAGDFTPVSIVGEPRCLVRSSFENIFIRLHSEPRKEDYYMSLVKIGDRFLVSEIIPASLCKGL